MTGVSLKGLGQVFYYIFLGKSKDEKGLKTYAKVMNE